MTEKRKIIKSIIFIVFMSIFQPFFDVILLFEYGGSAKCLDNFIIEDTFYISLLYIATPLLMLYLLFRILKWNSIVHYALIGLLFVVLSFNLITLPLFLDRIVAWTTYAENEILEGALVASVPTLLIQFFVITKMMYKINRKEIAEIKSSN
ncbi:hypothetical protein NAT51_08200 [Flavobacterium amniphilum]|uniref:hypothetical protein n=1 Tax=Flavobacterium amniphilum TaxID=1834035 RepID=UPI00202A0F13|nr:hypothetical protein [Flavobacterium amniphilum]MCL9805500.1 hypothetical protein [Flavobacterium amniphilum]